MTASKHKYFVSFIVVHQANSTNVLLCLCDQLSVKSLDNFLILRLLHLIIKVLIINFFKILPWHARNRRLFEIIWICTDNCLPLVIPVYEVEVVLTCFVDFNRNVVAWKYFLTRVRFLVKFCLRLPVFWFLGEWIIDTFETILGDQPLLPFYH